MILDYLDKSLIKPLDELTETRRDFPWFFIKDSVGYGKKSFPVFTHLIYEKDRKVNSTPELFDYVLNILNTICNKHYTRYHPATVFYKLSYEMISNRSIPSRDDVLDWLDARARQFGWLTLKDSLRNSVNKCRRRSIEFLRHTMIPNALNVLSDELREAYDIWGDAHEYMCEKIIENPMAYCDPQLYINNLDNWVAAPIIYTSNTMIFSDEENLRTLKEYLGQKEDGKDPRDEKIRVLFQITGPQSHHRYRRNHGSQSEPVG